MNDGNYWQIMFEQLQWWQVLSSFVCGLVVGFGYFKSLRWSILKLAESKHKIRLYVSVMLVRMAVFFLVLMLICQRNVALIVIYILAFYIARMIFFYKEKIVIVKEEKKPDA